MRYRFQVGTEVVCRTGQDEWTPGTIVRLNYREPHWPLGQVVPYRVETDDGGVIFVPEDHEIYCRKLVPPWWGDLFKRQRPSPPQLLQAAAGRDVNEQDHKESTALMAAMLNNWESVALQLIKMSADVNIPNKEEQCPLHIAVCYGEGMTRALLQAKADPNVQDNDPEFDPDFSSTTFGDIGDREEHRTPLHYCCGGFGHTAVATLLLQAGAELDMRDGQWKTPLHLAIEEGNTNLVDMLLQAKADVNLGNIQSGMNNTVLMDVSHAGKWELAEKLIAAKADINAQGKSDMSALHLAARRGDVRVVQVLVAARADVAQRSRCGTAADLARSKGGGSALLELLGAKADGPDGPRPGGRPTSIATMSAAERAGLFLE